MHTSSNFLSFSLFGGQVL